MDKKGALSDSHTPRPGWERLLDIFLRCAHVLVISLLFGGAVFKVPVSELVPWRILAGLSGLALVASEVLHSRRWPYQGRGAMVYLHVALFGLAAIWPGLAVACLAAALVIGMAGSHMPKRLRYWSFVHGRVKE